MSEPRVSPAQVDAPNIREVAGATILVREVRHSYNRTTYRVELLSGDWPADNTVIAAFGGYMDLGGGRVEHNGENHFTVVAYGCD